MKDTWTHQNNNKIIIWNAQLEQQRAEQAEQDRQANEEEEARRAQQEREAEEQRKAIELKRPKINSFDPNRSVSRWIEPRPAEYALERLKAKKYVKLDYFTERGCREAAADPNSSMSEDTFAFTQVDGTFALRPLATQRSSKNIRNDEDLSWGEMLEAKNTMLHFMDKHNWPATHTSSLALFYIALELHPLRLRTNGKRALLRYQGEVRVEWFDAFARDEGFNIEIIQEDLLKASVDYVNDRVRESEMEQVRVTITSTPEHPLISRLPLPHLSLSLSLHSSTPLLHCVLPAMHAHDPPFHHYNPHAAPLPTHSWHATSQSALFAARLFMARVVSAARLFAARDVPLHAYSLHVMFHRLPIRGARCPAACLFTACDVPLPAYSRYVMFRCLLIRGLRCFPLHAYSLHTMSHCLLIRGM